MTTEQYTLVTGEISYHITADEGMTFMRDNQDFGNEVWLGYRYRDSQGNVLDTPIFEQPSDYTEAVIEEDDDTAEDDETIVEQIRKLLNE